MPDLSASLPSALARQARLVRLGDREQIPVLLAHPDWSTPRPVMVWMHGRTANKELDPGRYLRWLRAELPDRTTGIAACAVDLPGHGERLDEALQHPRSTLDVLQQMVAEVDQVVAGLAARYPGLFDAARMGLGGMSAGGMATLRRLCDPHPFRCCAVEGTAGNLELLYLQPGDPLRPRLSAHAPDKVAALSAMRRVEQFRPIPLLALHSRADQVVPVACIETFVSALRGHYQRAGADPGQIVLHTWPQTGAPDEHSGFGRVAAEAKTIQTDFLAATLGGQA